MFSLRKPSTSDVEREIARAYSSPLSYSTSFRTEHGIDLVHVPDGYRLDHTRSAIGLGIASFKAAQSAFDGWWQFDLGWVRVANPDAKIEVGAIVAVEAHALKLWSINLSRILYVIDEEHRFGFGYGTTLHHVERGEERFLIEFDPATGIVHYDLLAVSQPAQWMARIAYPFTRRQQRRFARASHSRMQNLADSR